MMILFIDKIVAKTPKVLCIIIGIISVVLSIIFKPYTQKELYLEGAISKYKENVKHVHHWKGGNYDIEYYYIIVNGTRVDVALSEEKKFKGKERYWREILEGKYAKVCYLQKSTPTIYRIGRRQLFIPRPTRNIILRCWLVSVLRNCANSFVLHICHFAFLLSANFCIRRTSRVGVWK